MDNRNAVLHANRFAAGIERVDIELRDDDDLGNGVVFPSHGEYFLLFLFQKSSILFLAAK